MKAFKTGYRLCWAFLTASAAVLLLVLGACAGSKQAPSPEPKTDVPLIHYLKAQRQVAPSGTLKILCSALASDDSALSYEWSASGGKIQGEGDNATWAAPATAGEYDITVIVSSNKGGKAQGSVTVLVTPNPNRPPVVNSMSCRDCNSGIEASRWKAYSIHCDASDPESDKLSYKWSATIGKIQGEGNLATWQTVGEYGNALITVQVRDDKGNEAEGYLAINVSCCH